MSDAEQSQSTPNVNLDSSAGRKFKFALKSKREVDEHNRQVAEEKKKSKSRGLWGSIGSIVGAIVGVALAPVTAGMSLLATTGITAASAGVGSLIGGYGSREFSEHALGYERDDITPEGDASEALTEYISDDATETFKDIEHQEEVGLNTSALLSAITAGAMHGIGGGVTGEAKWFSSAEGSAAKGFGKGEWGKTFYGGKGFMGLGEGSLSFGESLKANIGSSWTGGVKDASSKLITEGINKSAVKTLFSSVGKGLGQSVALGAGKQMFFGGVPPDEQIQEKQDYPAMNLA